MRRSNWTPSSKGRNSSVSFHRRKRKQSESWRGSSPCCAVDLDSLVILTNEGECQLPHRYWLASPFSPEARIEISESEYGSLRRAVNSLLHCVEAEENFEGLL